MNRRDFIKTSSVSALAGAGSLSSLGALGRVSAAESQLPAGAVQFRPEIEPLVRLLEETPQDQVLEEVAHRVKNGLSYRDALAALLLAGVRNIQPRPVGFKFHAVLVVHSAHQAAINSPDSERWLPIFWAIDNFKSAQARDVREGNWTLSSVSGGAIPEAARARQAFEEAMDQWDEERADRAAAGVCRGLGMGEVFNLFCRYGARDYRDIGHKAIYVANGWRTLQVIGWRHGEPVLRSLAYALLMHEEGNPAQRDSYRDRDGRRNWERVPSFRTGWGRGRLDATATGQLLGALRTADSDAASRMVVETINQGVDPQSLWDAYFQFAGELLMRNPGIVSLHAATSSNALHYCFQTCSDDAVRRFLLMQTAAFLTLFRGKTLEASDRQIDRLQAGDKEGSPDLEGIFSEIDRRPRSAAELTYRYLQAGNSARSFIDQARRYIFLKGSNSHDYKFSSAVLEDYHHVSPEFRDRFLAASVFNLKGSEAGGNGLVERIRGVLG